MRLKKREGKWQKKKNNNNKMATTSLIWERIPYRTAECAVRQDLMGERHVTPRVQARPRDARSLDPTAPHTLRHGTRSLAH